jgi:hypothetical protein
MLQRKKKLCRACYSWSVEKEALDFADRALDFADKTLDFADRALDFADIKKITQIQW